MSISTTHSKSRQEMLKTLSEGLFRKVGPAGISGNILEIHHQAAPILNPVYLHPAVHRYCVSIRLNRGNERDPDQPIVCETACLPIQENVFSMVMLHHVVSDGMQAELDEAVRVLARDGVLLILGINRMGWRFRSQDRFRKLPGISPLKVKSRLDRLEMNLQKFTGAGLFGMKRPEFMGSGLAGLGSPIADVVLLQARHRSGPEMTPLARSNPVQSTPW